MDLENFPTSESAIRMLDSVSKGFYAKSYVGKWLYQVMGLEMDEAVQIFEELPYQAFPETATWGLFYHEIKWGLPVREHLPYDERRVYIYQKRDMRSPMNPYRMEVILGDVLGRKVLVDDGSGPANTFTVEVEDGDGVADVSSAVRQLHRIKQSHVSFALRFVTVVGLQIGTMANGHKSRYTQCGTVPMVSTGLKLANAGVDVDVERAFSKIRYPMVGESGNSGIYPKTSNGLKIAESDILAGASGEGYPVAYPKTSTELKTGTIPKVSTVGKLAGESVVPTIITEGYQMRYPLCGNTFEI